MTEYGIFNDESQNYTENEAVEAGFWSREEAEAVLKDRYCDDDECHVHAVEESEEEDEDEECEEECDDEDSESYPVKG